MKSHNSYSPSSSSSEYEDRFPQKLYSILTFGRVDSITWFEEGSRFRIIDPRAFESNVINKYFSQRKIRSFFRQLNSYGFVRVSGTSWRNKYSFSHPLFQRGFPHLLRGMQRRKPSFYRKPAKVKTRTATETPDDTLSVESSATPDVPRSTVSNASQAPLSSMSTDTNSSCSSVSRSSENTFSSSTVTIPCITHHDQPSTVWMNEEGTSYDIGLTDQQIALLKEILGMDSP